MASFRNPSACANHTPAPHAGSTTWHIWAWRMSRHSKQISCRGCGRPRIWVPKEAAA